MSDKQDYGTPGDLFSALNDEFLFDLDAAASAENSKCRRFFSESDSALTKSWVLHGDSIFCNPPFELIPEFLSKGIQAAKDGAIVVFVVPARTGRNYWHELVYPFASVRFLKGHPQFEGADNPCHFDVAILIYSPDSISGKRDIKPWAIGERIFPIEQRRPRIKSVNPLMVAHKEILNYEDAAALLSMSKRQIERHVNRGELSTVGMSKHRRGITRAQIDEFVRKREQRNGFIR